MASSRSTGSACHSHVHRPRRACRTVGGGMWRYAVAAIAAAAALGSGLVGAQPASRSLGLPWAGSLVGGVQLPAEGEHFFTWDNVRRRSPNRGWRRWGNRRLVTTALRVLDDYAAAHPGAPRVGIGAAKVFVGPHTRLKGPPAVVEVLPAHHDNHMHVRLPGDGVRSVPVGESTRGQPIRAFTLGSGRPRILVVGCIHGDECAGSVVATRLLHARPPRRGSITVVQDLNPDGHAAKRRTNARRVDLNRNFPGTWRPLATAGPAPASEVETQLAMQLVLGLRPDVTIWFHQPQGLVRAWGPSVRVARRYARLAGMRFARLRWPPGSATAWQHGALPASRAFVVELPPGELGIREAGRYAAAVLRLASRGPPTAPGTSRPW